MISIQNLDKAQVLQALYAMARPQGMGFLHYDPAPMTLDEARGYVTRSSPGFHPSLYFDYIKGRVMKVDLSQSSFDESLYDRDNGPGAALMALQDAGLIP